MIVDIGKTGGMRSMRPAPDIGGRRRLLADGAIVLRARANNQPLPIAERRAIRGKGALYIVPGS